MTPCANLRSIEIPVGPSVSTMGINPPKGRQLLGDRLTTKLVSCVDVATLLVRSK